MRQKASGSQETATQKPVTDTESNKRITKIEADIAKVSTNMNKQYEELKHLVSTGQAEQRPSQDVPTQATATNRPPPAFSQQSKGKPKAWTNQQTLPPDNPRPVQNAYLNRRYSQNLYTNSCWHCGIAGHISRNCPMKTQGITYSQPPSSFINRGSKNKDQANVYIQMTLYDKGMSFLAADLFDRGRNICMGLSVS